MLHSTLRGFRLLTELALDDVQSYSLQATESDQWQQEAGAALLKEENSFSVGSHWSKLFNCYKHLMSPEDVPCQL